MLVARRTLLRQSVAVCDALTLAATFAASYRLRGPAQEALGPFHDFLWMLWVIEPAWLLSMWSCGLYNSATYRRVATLVAALVQAQFIAGLMLLSSMYLTKAVEVSRVMTQIFIALSFGFLLAQKLALHTMLARWRGRRSMHRPRVLLIGTAQDATRYIGLVEQHASMAAEVVGVLSPSDDVTQGPARPPILGIPHDLPEMLRAMIVDEVVVLTRLWPALLNRVASTCATRGVVMRMMLDVPSATVGAWRADDCGGGIFFLSLAAVSEDALRLALKRVLDVVGALVGLLLCALAMIFYGRRLRRETGASVLFRQQRVGQNGRRFVLYKFRTMGRDAEQRLEQLRATNQMRGPMFKLENDPRVTCTGRLLRRRHLDELPQFWNVLRGEMSLVGTRPPTEEEVKRYNEHHHRRLSMKPGLTGLWQLNGNQHVSDFEQVVKLDCEYIERWSLRRDLLIMLATVRKVLRADAW